MIVFESQEAFEEAVMRVMFARMTVGVTVSRIADYHCSADDKTKVKVTLFDNKTGDDIDTSSDYA